MLSLILAIVALALVAGVVLYIWGRAARTAVRTPNHSITRAWFGPDASQIPRYRGGAGPARWTRKGH